MKVKITAEHGLHARPLASFVKAASVPFAEVFLKSGEKEASAKSMFKLLSLGVKNNDFVELIVKPAAGVAENDPKIEELKRILSKMLEEMK